MDELDKSFGTAFNASSSNLEASPPTKSPDSKVKPPDSEYLEDDDDSQAVLITSKGRKTTEPRRIHVTYENERIWLGLWTHKMFPGGMHSHI